MIPPDVSAALADFLTRLNAKDPVFVKELLNHRITVNHDDLEVVCPAEMLPYRASALGVLNGFLDAIDQPRVCFIEQDNGDIAGFAPVGNVWRTIEVNGITLELDARAPEAEVERIKGLLGSLNDLLLVNYRARIVKLPEGANFMLVCALDVPPAELDALHHHLKQARVDPDYSVVTNYAVTMTGDWSGKP